MATDLRLFVSQDGSDGWSGRLPSSNRDGTDGPFATLERARDEIRRMKAKGPLPKGGATVIVRGGAYTRTDSFELRAEDSGAEDAPVVYRAAKGERARILGGPVVRTFTPVTDPSVLKRLDERARGHVVQADLKAQGISDVGSLSSRGFARPVVPAHLELFFNGEPMTLARWPNRGEFLTIADYTVPETDEWGQTTGSLKGGFRYEGDRPKHWAASDDIWVHGYWSYDWANSYERVRHLDPGERIVETYPPHGNYSFRKGQRFHFLNVLEELDEPGEYYVDRTGAILYFWPPEPIERGEAMVSVLEKPLVVMRDVQHVALSDFAMECSRGNVVEVTGGADNRVIGCTLRNAGNWGVVVRGGTSHVVAGCNVYNNGDGGIEVSGGDRKTLTPANHAVLNNHIHHIARWSRCYQAPVNASGVGHRIAHNLIHDAPHNGILFWGNDILIESNEIHSVCLETGDVGAIYTGRDWTFRGNVIRHNFIHHTGGVGMGSMAVYMDDCVSGTHIVGNIFWKATRAVFLGGGRDFFVENNVFVDCDPAIELDNRGMSEHPVWRKMVHGFMKEQLDAMCHHEPPYTVRYPEIAAVDEYYATGAGIPPEGNVIARNVCVGRWLHIVKEVANLVEVRGNLVDEDPRFLDAAYGDFRLQDNSPAFRLGFKPIPVDRIGLVRDEYRATLPPKVASRLERVEPAAGSGVGIRLSVRNVGTVPAQGEVSARITPKEAARVVGSSLLSYRLRPGEAMSTEFLIVGFTGSVTVETVPQGIALRPSRLRVDAQG